MKRVSVCHDDDDDSHYVRSDKPMVGKEEVGRRKEWYEVSDEKHECFLIVAFDISYANVFSFNILDCVRKKASADKDEEYRDDDPCCPRLPVFAAR